MGRLLVSIRSTAIVLASLIYIATAVPAAKADSYLDMSATGFENAVREAVAWRPDFREVPAICPAAIDRLRAERFVTDRAVQWCVEAYVNAAANRALATKSKVLPPPSGAAEAYIDEVVPLLVDRDYLRARLLARKGELALGSGNAYQSAAPVFKAALEVVDPLRLNVDVERLKILNMLGGSLLSQGAGDPFHLTSEQQRLRKEADHYFLQVLAYNWYTVVDHPQEMQSLRDRYVDAGFGLIACRRGDLKALQEIHFVPAVDSILRPKLDQAIEEAKHPER